MGQIQLMILGVFSTFLVLQQSCTKDTCNDADTFSEMQAMLVFDTQENWINLNWQQGKILPKSYFDEIFIFNSDKDKYGMDQENSSSSIDQIRVNSENDLDIFLKEDAWINVPQEFHFHFIFPDRKKHTDCDHLGSEDEYFLDLSFLIRGAVDSLILESFKWEETFFPGPF